MYDEIIGVLRESIRQNPPDAVLFSGGPDSSLILALAREVNPDVVPITVGIKGEQSSDVEYSKEVAKKMGVTNHEIYYVTKEQVHSVVELAVNAMKSFNPECISSATTLLLGTMYARKKGLECIAGGEGADDLFGSFPFFKKWEGTLESLDKAITTRLGEVGIMSEVVAKMNGMTCITPFRDKKVEETILDIPIGERVKKEGKIETKYPLRMACKGILPDEAIVRPQTMAFTGSGLYDVIRSIGNDISDQEFAQAREEILKFRNKFEYALYKIYSKSNKIQKDENGGGCMHCGSRMGEGAICCATCNTIQMEGKAIDFAGNEMEENAGVKGVEAIVTHDGKIVIGMQQAKRWHNLQNGEQAAIIKTIGGKVEPEDRNDTLTAIKREISEEIKGVSTGCMKIEPIFSQKTTMGKINPFVPNSKLPMQAEFYRVEIPKNAEITIGDLPALFEIPISKFLEFNFAQPMDISKLEPYIKCNDGFRSQLPQKCALMIPEEVREYLLRQQFQDGVNVGEDKNAR